MTDDHDRRSLLRAGAALCSFGVTGCLDSGDGDSASDPTGSETGADDSTGTDTGTNGTDTDGTDTDGNATDPGGDPEPEPVTSWPMQQYDARNTGAVPDAAAPTENVGKLWSVELDARIDASPVVADGTVYVGDRSGTVHALDAESGDGLWTGTVPGDEVRGTAAVYGDLLIVPHDGGAAGLDRDDGNVEWAFDTASGATDITVAEDTAVFGDTGSSLHGVEADTGQDLWEHEGDQGPEDFTEAPAVYNGDVIVPDGWMELIAVDIESGDKRTLANTNGEYGYRSPVSIADEMIYVGTSIGIQALEDFENGFASEWWHFRTEHPVEGGIAVADDTILGIEPNGTEGRLFSIDREEHKVAWNDQTWSNDDSGLILIGDSVILADSNRRAISFDLNNGEELWRVETAFAGYHHGAFADGRLYIVATEGPIYAIGEE